MDYDGTTTHRYITFPTADSYREVNLSSSIRPGALIDSYSVQWESSIPGVPGITIVDTGHYDITEDINSASHHQYQCKVSIQHRSDIEEIYDCPKIIFKKIGEISLIYMYVYVQYLITWVHHHVLPHCSTGHNRK